MTPEYGQFEFRATERQNGSRKDVTIPLNTCTQKQIEKAL
jgi:hypothetical protein